MNKVWKHFKTVTYHKYLVAKGCFRVGLYRQGIFHDMSKYGPTEFLVGVKYFQGDRSPNNAEREDIGYSSAWLHHKGRNKHHYEYWIDYRSGKEAKLIPVPMPKRYVAEMIMDRIAASKVYRGDEYKNEDPLLYYLMGKDSGLIHEETAKMLERILRILAEEGEEAMYAAVRKELVNKR